MNDAEFYFKACGFLALLAGFVGIVWRVSRVYATNEQCEKVAAQCEKTAKEISKRIDALNTRVDEIEDALSDGRVTFATVQTELSAIKEILAELKDQFKMVFQGRVIAPAPQCSVASEQEKRGHI